MFNKKVIITVIFVFSLLLNVGLLLLVFNNAYATARVAEGQQVNLKILSFTNLFIENVLMSKKDVDFETRLMLETAVRNIGDEEVTGQWQKFTTASNGESAGDEAKLLLDLLVKKISY